MEHSKYIVEDWSWQILSAISSIATAGEPGEMFLSGKQPAISPILRRPNFATFEYNTSIGVAMKTFRTEF